MKNIEELMKKIQEIEEKGELSDEALAAAVGGATMPDLSIYNLQGRTVDAIRCPLCKGVADYSASMFTIYYFTCRNCKQKLTTVFLRTGEIFTTPGVYTEGVVE